MSPDQRDMARSIYEVALILIAIIVYGALAVLVACFFWWLLSVAGLV